MATAVAMPAIGAQTMKCRFKAITSVDWIEVASPAYRHLQALTTPKSKSVKLRANEPVEGLRRGFFACISRIVRDFHADKSGRT
jgi:hypothetical protein